MPRARQSLSKSPLLATCCLLGLAAVAHAQAKPKVSAVLDSTALAARRPARLAVVIDVPKGFHAQSNTPLDESLIKCEVKPNAAPAGVSFGEIVYPAGEKKNYPALGALSVYEGRQVIVVPVVVTTAPAGEVTFSGKITLQLCDDEACFAPESIKFSVKTTIVADASAVRPANAKVFPPATRPAGH